MKKMMILLLVLLTSFSLASCNVVGDKLGDVTDSATEFADSVKPDYDNLEDNKTKPKPKQKAGKIQKRGFYTSKDEVAEYLNKYDRLPKNYITKREASDAGWDPGKGNLWDVTDENIIGGDQFGNREKLLPEKEGRRYYECDVNYAGGFRDAQRLVYSNDGLIYYTKDHYESFTLLYGDE